MSDDEGFGFFAASARLLGCLLYGVDMRMARSFVSRVIRFFVAPTRCSELAGLNLTILKIGKNKLGETAFEVVAPTFTFRTC